MQVFLYGTLISASETPMARWLAPRLGTMARASVGGALVAVPSRDGWYPALVPARRGERTWGIVCATRLGRGDLARLDRYEGREYRRVTVSVRRADGRRVRAQLYRWRGPPPRAAEPIAGGDFLAWLAATGRAPLSGSRRERE